VKADVLHNTPTYTHRPCPLVEEGPHRQGEGQGREEEAATHWYVPSLPPSLPFTIPPSNPPFLPPSLPPSFPPSGEVGADGEQIARRKKKGVVEGGAAAAAAARSLLYDQLTLPEVRKEGREGGREG